MQHFNLDELKTFCSDSGLVDFENLKGDTLEGKARELVDYFDRNASLQILIDDLNKVRPSIFPQELLFHQSAKHNLLRRPLITNREHETNKIYNSILNNSITTIIGRAGYGKTVLAVEIGYRVLENGLFDYVIWSTARGQSLTFSDILDQTLRTSENSAAFRLSHTNKISLVLDILRGNRCLLIIDNAESINDTDLINFINDLPHPSKVLLTTRSLRSLRDECIVEIGPLTSKDALLLAETELIRLGFEEKAMSRSAMENLAKVSFGIPLAIKLAVGQVRYEGRVLSQVVEDLMHGDEKLLAIFFGDSWKLLSDPGKVMLMVLAIVPESISAKLVQTTIHADTNSLNRTVSELINLGLIEADNLLGSEARYTLHPLTRAFILNQITNDKKNEIQKDLALSYAIFLEMLSGDLQKTEFAYREIATELTNILFTLQWLNKGKEIEIELKIVDNLLRFLWNTGSWDIRLEILLRILNRLDSHTQTNKIAYYYCQIAWIYSRRREIELAMTWIQKAETVASQDGGSFHNGLAHHIKGQIYFRSSKFEMADTEMKLAIAAYEKTNEIELSKQIAIADVWDSLGDLNRDWGIWLEENNQPYKLSVAKYVEAQAWYQQLLEFAVKNGWQEKIATANGDLGHLNLYLGNFDNTKEHLTNGLSIAQRIGRKHTIAYCSLGLGQLEANLGMQHHKQAIKHLNDALSIYRELKQEKVMKDIHKLIDLLQGPSLKRRYYLAARRFKKWIRY